MRIYIASALLFGLLSMSAHSAVFNLTASIDGAQANAGAGTGSAGTGSAAMTYDDASGLFSWNISWSGLSGPVAVAHFHGAAGPGVNAGVQVNFGAISGLTSPSIGSAAITAGQAGDLLNDLWYINIHTALNPGGEIRGQVNVVPLPAAAWFFISALGGLIVAKRKKA